MIITNTAKNTMPEQVQENMDNIQRLDEALESIENKVVYKKIWENPNPNQSFASAVVSIADVNFERFLIAFTDIETGSKAYIEKPFVKDYKTTVQFLSSIYFYEREVTFDALNDEIVFSDATLNNITNGTYTVNNNILIPIAIYGVNSEIVE